MQRPGHTPASQHISVGRQVGWYIARGRLGKVDLVQACIFCGNQQQCQVLGVCSAKGNSSVDMMLRLGYRMGVFWRICSVALQLTSSSFCFCHFSPVWFYAELAVCVNNLRMAVCMLCRKVTECTRVSFWAAVWVPFFIWKSTAHPELTEISSTEWKFLSAKV